MKKPEHTIQVEWPCGMVYRVRLTPKKDRVVVYEHYWAWELFATYSVAELQRAVKQRLPKAVAETNYLGRTCSLYYSELEHVLSRYDNEEEAIVFREYWFEVKRAVRKTLRELGIKQPSSNRQEWRAPKRVHKCAVCEGSTLFNVLDYWGENLCFPCSTWLARLIDALGR